MALKTSEAIETITPHLRSPHYRRLASEMQGAFQLLEHSHSGGLDEDEEEQRQLLEKKVYDHLTDSGLKEIETDLHPLTLAASAEPIFKTREQALFYTRLFNVLRGTAKRTDFIEPHYALLQTAALGTPYFVWPRDVEEPREFDPVSSVAELEYRLKHYAQMPTSDINRQFKHLFLTPEGFRLSFKTMLCELESVKRALKKESASAGRFRNLLSRAGVTFKTRG